MNKVYRKSRRRRGAKGSFFYPLSAAVVCLFLVIGATAVIYAYGNSKHMPQSPPPSPSSVDSLPQESQQTSAQAALPRPESSAPESQASVPEEDSTAGEVSSRKPEPSEPEKPQPSAAPPEETENNSKQKDFSSSIFIGDSRTEGLELYGGLKEAAFLDHKGMTVDTIFTKPAISTSAGKLTVMDALKRESFEEIYIMLGVNELGYVYSEIFIKRYEKIIDGIREFNPDVKVYVQAILPVTKEKSDNDGVFNNTRIREYNTLLREMAERKGAVYLEVNKAVQNANGELPADASTDGVHLTAEYYKKWGDYLRNSSL